jgi:transcriptional regulator with XRE-family HTH domain
MSELFLVLRRRLEDVVDWTHLGTETLRLARKRKGLSYEGISRLLNVSSKTAERWEKQGRVPTHRLAAVATLLDLEIEELPPIRAGVSADDPEVAAQLDRMEKLLLRVAQAVGVDSPDQRAA